MPVRTSRPAARRTRRKAAVVAAAILPTVGLIAASGSSNPVLGAVNLSSNSVADMAYDRDLVGELHRRTGEARRQKVLDWFRLAAALDDSRREADLQRASRGEPRQALTGSPDSGSAEYWRPTTGRLTQPYHPGHGGIDLGVPVGTPVVAAAGGTVVFAGTQSGYGTHVEVRHADGAVTTYSHLSTIEVAVGEPVEAGQEIADSGNTGRSTGPHLHFELRPGEGRTSDPIAWLQSHGAW